uniref:Uncharacterized protein n=1 Tax=Chromera velia CCMP2878 TaxID=1169474 RepID=A0A0G4I6H6_9ALVE|eukprot:Cvel_11417.t1-p1 / transcript=Cvel_11417.t1 / gene=Cvel_11417 / organism=Chromera_velia_CCMP2878 / gene_product=hypothetical protein / transcript_product=hypothetical protein / location=Cvel_scaffold717:60907-62589(+) / protein_length=561 / sequence_SO=supercontig / SO=protein_coding / is_pseudo=false
MTWLVWAFPTSQVTENNRALLASSGFIGIGICTPQVFFEFFLPLRSFLVFKGLQGVACGVGGTVWGVLTFYFSPYGNGSILVQSAVFLILTLPHVYTISYIRGLQQDAENVERRLRVADPQPEPPKKGTCCRCVRIFGLHLIRLFSPVLAKSAFHAGLIHFIKTSAEYLDLSTDIAPGMFFLRAKSTLPSGLHLTFSYTLIVFAVLDMLPFAIKYSLLGGMLSETMKIWICGTTAFCELMILVASLVLTVFIWDEFCDDAIAMMFIMMDILSTVLGIIISLISMYVNGFDRRLHAAMHQMSKSVRTITHSPAFGARSPNLSPRHRGEDTSPSTKGGSPSPKRSEDKMRDRLSFCLNSDPEEEYNPPPIPESQEHDPKSSQAGKTEHQQQQQQQKREEEEQKVETQHSEASAPPDAPSALLQIAALPRDEISVDGSDGFPPSNEKFPAQPHISPSFGRKQGRDGDGEERDTGEEEGKPPEDQILFVTRNGRLLPRIFSLDGPQGRWGGPSSTSNKPIRPQSPTTEFDRRSSSCSSSSLSAMPKEPNAHGVRHSVSTIEDGLE